MKKLFILFSMLLTSFINKAQDGTVYAQSDATMFSNQYIFLSNGTFKHFYTTDDAQIWYGTGNYIDNGKYRTLYFKEADTTMNDYEGWKIYYETNFQRILIKKGYGFKSFEKNSNTGKPGIKLKIKEP